jgi:NADH:ubiquinone oxidoreductase subunit E
MSEKEFIYKQHEENTEWSNKLEFYKDELKIIQHRLEEIADKNNSKEVLSIVEQFQNQLLIQRNAIDEIQHNLNISEDKLHREIERNPVATDHRKTEYHQAEKDELQIFEKLFSELRENFNRFASKWM